MQFKSLFQKREVVQKRQKVDIFTLDIGAICYYNSYKTAFRVTDKGISNRGVSFVEIASVNSQKTYMFTQKHLVEIEAVTGV